MAATTTTTSNDDVTTPFLRSSSSQSEDTSLRRQTLRSAARFLQRASSRRLMRAPSVTVRETAAEQLEERQSDWAYSKPVVFFDVIWNLMFVAVGVVVLGLSTEEAPEKPLRLWTLGYGLQCLVHIVCVCVEYRKRRRRQVILAEFEGESSSLAKHLESANTMFSFIWWIIGFYWVSAGGQTLARDSPQLYWLCVAFLAFDVFFVFFCVALACVIGIAVCCCLPCIIAILYAVTDQEGASKEDVEQLSKYKFRKIGNVEKLSGEIQGPCGGVMIECDTDSPTEHALSPEDAECCICLIGYDDEDDLRQLPCNHHFHSTCVDKWLYINATCPLCKYNILKTSSSFGREEV